MLVHINNKYSQLDTAHLPHSGLSGVKNTCEADKHNLCVAECVVVVVVVHVRYDKK